MIEIFWFFVGIGLGASIVFGLTYWYLKDLFPIEEKPIPAQPNEIKEKVWSIFLDDPRTIGFTSKLIGKYVGISEESADTILRDLFYKNQLTRVETPGFRKIYYRNPAALYEFNCKKCGTRNTPKQPNSFASGYNKVKHGDKPTV